MTGVMFPRATSKPEVRWAPGVGLLLRWPGADWYQVTGPPPSITPWDRALPDDAEEMQCRPPA